MNGCWCDKPRYQVGDESTLEDGWYCIDCIKEEAKQVEPQEFIDHHMCCAGYSIGYGHNTCGWSRDTMIKACQELARLQTARAWNL